MRYHRVEIWRSNDTKLWHHRFVASNGRELVRQSEGIVKRSQAITSAQVAYGLGPLQPNTPTEWLCGRSDVLVYIQRTRRGTNDEH